MSITCVLIELVFRNKNRKFRRFISNNNQRVMIHRTNYFSKDLQESKFFKSYQMYMSKFSLRKVFCMRCQIEVSGCTSRITIYVNMSEFLMKIVGFDIENISLSNKEKKTSLGLYFLRFVTFLMIIQ